MPKSFKKNQLKHLFAQRLRLRLLLIDDFYPVGNKLGDLFRSELAKIEIKMAAIQLNLTY